MAQADGESPPPAWWKIRTVHKRVREESANDIGDCDEVRGHSCPAPTTNEIREVAINMLPGPDPTKDHPCDGCGNEVTGVSRAAVGN